MTWTDPVCSRCGRKIAGNHGDGWWRHIDLWSPKCGGERIVPKEAG
jgi:hypothetical protein